MRSRYFDEDMFADPAWDMLLDLFAAQLERLCEGGAFVVDLDLVAI